MIIAYLASPAPLSAFGRTKLRGQAGMEAMQKQIVKLFAAESEDVRRIMMAINN